MHFLRSLFSDVLRLKNIKMSNGKCTYVKGYQKDKVANPLVNAEMHEVSILYMN